MAIKVQFEIGHSATVKSKRTPEGFTHDWELYVQGVNKADISAFVEKVVFNLHDSFPKPKRSFKEPPYVLKESGYAGFVLTIDIYFRNRDEPKRVPFSYDLDLQQEGPPLHRSEVKKFIFEAPSEEFRQKLLKGGGVAVSGVVGGTVTTDERSIDMSVPDNRSQMVGKPKLSSDATSTSSSKKHKQRPDDSKSNTFTNLFGPPINKTAPKFSPDPKMKTANGGTGAPLAAAAVANSKSGGGKDKVNSGGSAAAAGTTASTPAPSSGKEKDKSEKKDKHKQQISPHKEKTHEEKESKKKSDGKHEKRDEKRKDKKDKDKDRERNKDKVSKRSLSPKSAAVAAPSPKRPSPVRSSSAASRDDPNTTVKSMSKTSEIDKRASGTSSGKKSKKEKKSHDKEREHKDKHRAETKEIIPAVNALSVATAPPSAAVVTPAPTQPPPHATSKNPTAISKPSLKSSEKDSEKKKTDSISKAADKEFIPLANEKKSTTEKDKKSHKHKKKDKNKEKEKDKDKDKDQPSKKSTGTKEKKDKKEKIAKNEATTAADAATSKKTELTVVEPTTESANTKPTTTSSKVSKPSNNALTVPTNNTNSSTNSNNTINMETSSSGLLNTANDLSDVDSFNSESLNTISNSNSEKAVAIQNSDSSNSSFPDLPAAKTASSLFQAPANPQPTPPPSSISTPSSTPSLLSSVTAEPTRAAPTAEKKDHKPHRGADKTKAEKAAEKEDKKRRRNSTAVNTFVEPPLKQIKKDFNAKTTREKSQSPLLRVEDKQTFLPPPATTSTLLAQNTPVSALNLEYLSELQELHQKIMTLQDNEELQQVVEMIAATGRYEITSKTFDFDLCKLDRNTVQRLQDFFATSVS